MPEDEGWALHRVAVDAAILGPLLEIGSYCGKSTIYLGAAARRAGTVVFAVDHHRGSQEQQAGWDHHDEGLVDPATGRMDSLGCFRSTIETAGLEDVVIAVVGSSVTVAAHWGTGLGLCFVDGGHAPDVVQADAAAWWGHVLPGGFLAFHDVFEHAADGGQGPYEAWQRLAADVAWEPLSTTGSLRVLRRRR
jgi:predicted O-methyltransferase YrrM